MAAAGCSLLMTEPEPLEGGLVFHLQELHDFSYTRVGEPVVALFIETEKHYPSISYDLRGSIRRQGNTIRIDVSGVAPCDMCLGAVGPAQRKEMLPLTEGEYPLAITYRGHTDRYLVSVSPEAIEVSRESASFTTPRFERFWRYPPNSFAYLCDAAGQEEACGEFREILHANLALQPLSFPPGGEIPYPGPYSAYGLDWRAEYYRYASAADFAKAGELLRTFIASRPGVRLYLMNWRNEQYRSWLGGN